MKRVPWLALGGLVLGFGLWAAGRLVPVAGLFPDCAFKRVMGFSCATCGLTRCAMALGRGQWMEALYWHPAAAAVVLLWPVVAFWDLRRAWKAEPYPSLPDSRLARMSVWALLAAIWLLQLVRGI
jgi:hypothetical protein